MAGTKVPAKFEQGGFTSGRRKGPQTLFPGASPGNRVGDSRHRNSITAICTNWSALTTRNFYWLVCKNPKARGVAAGNLAAGVQPDISSAESPLLYAVENRGKR